MKWYWITLIVVAGVIVIYFLLSFIISIFVSRMLYAPKRYSREEQRAYNEKMGYNVGTEGLETNDVLFTMSDGYLIHASINLIKDSKKFCILAHGHQTTREGALRYAAIFRDLGYSTIIYDERGHGDNVRGIVTMGHKESYDLGQIVEQVYEKYGEDITLGLQGVSMGAFTCLMSLKYIDKLAFVVSDCAFSSLKEVVKNQIHHFHLPSFPLMGFIDFNLKAFAHFSFSDCEIADSLKNNNVPILFIHGEADTYVDPNNAKRLYDSDAGYKELVYFPNAPHASSITLDREKYVSSIKSFLNNIRR